MFVKRKRQLYDARKRSPLASVSYQNRSLTFIKIFYIIIVESIKKVGEILNKKIKIKLTALALKIIKFLIIWLNKIADKIFDKVIKLIPQRAPQQLNYGISTKLLYSHVQLILRYELLEEVFDDKDSLDVLNTVFYNEYNGIILLRACSRAFMERILQDSFNDEVDCKSLSNEELLEFMPEVYCGDADIVELNDGRAKAYLVDYNAEIEELEGEEYYYDIFRRKGKS